MIDFLHEFFHRDNQDSTEDRLDWTFPPHCAGLCWDWDCCFLKSHACELLFMDEVNVCNQSHTCPTSMSALSSPSSSSASWEAVMSHDCQKQTRNFRTVTIAATAKHKNAWTEDSNMGSSHATRQWLTSRSWLLCFAARSYRILVTLMMLNWEQNRPKNCLSLSAWVKRMCWSSRWQKGG